MTRTRKRKKGKTQDRVDAPKKKTKPSPNPPKIKLKPPAKPVSRTQEWLMRLLFEIYRVYTYEIYRG